MQNVRETMNKKGIKRDYVRKKERENIEIRET